MQEACALILEFTQGVSFEEYCNDRKLQSAVERQFEITGEALNQLYKIDPKLASRIPEYSKIIAFRNILIHSYSTISNEIVWGIVESKLQSLLDTIKQFISE